MEKKLCSLLIIITIVLVVLIVKALLFFTAKPKVTVNYVTELNRITRPANYDTNENAAPYYQKAFDTFVKMPQELRIPFINWPADYNSIHQGKLEEWLASNSHVFEYFRIASDKPYYWLARQTKKDNNMMSIMLPELLPLHQLTEALTWNAKLNASKGQFQSAFENILDCYRAGRQKCRTLSLPMEQHTGLGAKQTTLCTAAVILDRAPVDSTTLKFLQDALQAELTEDAYVPDIQAEKLMLYDALQRTFIDNGRGTGRLAWRMAKGFTAPCGQWYNFKVYLNCFIGPTRNEMLEQIEQLFTLFGPLKTQTPSQLYKQDSNYFKKIEAIHRDNFFLGLLGTNPRRIFQLHHKVRTQTEALLTILAVLRFKADNNRFPVTLDELVDTGYLESIPKDPYSEGPLAYKHTKDNFKLYSVGEDFSDDGGMTSDTYMSTSKWSSSSPNVFSADIVYWPVKRLERPRLPRFRKMDNSLTGTLE